MNAQRRQAAIAAALDALDGLEDTPWTAMGAALDAAAPHLVGEPVGYSVATPDSATFDTPAQARAWADGNVPGPHRVVALVPVEDEP